MIAQVLLFNYYRAKLTLLEKRGRSFRPRFRNQRQKFIWSDFMRLQSIQMRVMNDGLAFLARISNDLNATDAVIVTDGETPTGDLWAVDFGAINDSEKTMFTIVRSVPGVTAASLSISCQGPDSPSLHREGVSMYAQVTDDITQAMKYSCHIIDQATDLKLFRVGGTKCLACHSSPTSRISRDSLSLVNQYSVRFEEGLALRHGMRIRIRRQDRALKTQWRSRRAQRRVRGLAAHGVL